MKLVRCATIEELARAAARDGARLVREALRDRGEATIVVATGLSQAAMLADLVTAPDLDWRRVTAFHLDEYIGLPEGHPASFRRYLRERFVSRVPLREFIEVRGEGSPEEECARLKRLLAPRTVDVAFIGIGENGHLAFNDPPADFETVEPYLIVRLDEACRRQQLGEGWFPTLPDVPREAISMSVRQILKAKAIVCSVPDRRKARAVRDAVEGPVTPRVPASILQEHPEASVYCDRESASLLPPAQ